MTGSSTARPTNSGPASGPDAPQTLLVGLTGGIASGKSAVSARMAERGALVIDADVLSRYALQPGGAALAEVVEAFGESVLQPDGALDRAALGAVVFGDPKDRERLNRIVHPRVRQQARALRERAEPGSIIVEDIPLLVETGQSDRFDVVVVVRAPQKERIRRIVEDRDSTEADARARIEAQATDAQRVAAADVVLDNSGTLEELHDQVDDLMDRLLRPDRGGLAG
ncbi:dephospho-CoA kinase [Nesterenkonia xinjiangensis]|uniref:Dephospho-CoA kinase n=1 Tax=Nesterenkonia xinjiangensis TaxID=225327 RepID=A0A7Z0GNU1_9MICC|nr:dephospho-CoA kinase [Nesterenkonia xinjiangensis]NYJ79362.1 dephospho-CoA kinase [Nesterenkonia xinjiangensis]